VMSMSASSGLRRDLREAVHLVDATSIRLTEVSRAWADYKAHGALVKLHVDFDADRSIPANIAITPARINDVCMVGTMPIEPGATYVFDLGYYDFSWWSQLVAQGCRFVTRLKTHTRPRVIEERSVEAGSCICADRIVAIDGRLKSVRGARHPLAGMALREILVSIEDGRTLRLVTNDLEAPATDIAALYKARWQVELFFRWIKQHLKIKRFLGTSENAIRIQIAVALIVFLLLRLAAAASRSACSLLTFVRLVRANLMHSRPLAGLAKPPPEFLTDTRQQELNLC
jgi:IS4 transposase